MTESLAVGARTDTHPPQIALVDLLDRLLGTGVVLAGDVTISLTGIDLVEVKLYALISSVRAGNGAEKGNGTGGERAR